MKKKAKKHKDDQSFAYSILKRVCSKKRKKLIISLSEYTSLKNKGCESCKKSLSSRSMCVELINKKGDFSKDNLKAICAVCKAEKAASEFDFIKYSINQLRRGWKKTPYALLAIAKAKNNDGQIQCASCSKWFSQLQTNLDHVHPAIPVETGYTSLDDFAKRLLDNPPLQNLCINCHKEKTTKERSLRKQHGSIKAGKKRKQEQRDE